MNQTMTYRSMLTPREVKPYIQRLNEEEGETDYCKGLIRDFLNLTKKIDIRISNGITLEEVKDNGTNHNYIQYNVIVSRKYRRRAIKTSFVINRPLKSNLPQPDLSDILLCIRETMSFMPKDFEEYCEASGKNIHDSTSKIDYQKEVKTVGDLKKIFTEMEMECLPTSSSMSDGIIKSLIFIDDITDYNKLKDLRGQVEHYGKLLTQYGYDLSTGEQNTKLAPVTKTDSQLEGMQSDIEEYNKRSEEYKHVVKKYNSGVFDEQENYLFTIPESRKNQKR